MAALTFMLALTPAAADGAPAVGNVAPTAVSVADTYSGAVSATVSLSLAVT